MIEKTATESNEFNEPTGPANDNNDEELHADIWREVKLARNHFSEWRSEAIKDYDFYAGRQWTEEEIAKLAKDERLPVCFNRIPRTINAMCGLEVQNRQEPNCYPVEESDTGSGEYNTNVLRWVRQSCDAEDEDSEGFKDLGICGMGWTETYVDFNGMKRDILIGRIDPLEMLYDPQSKKNNCTDARWVAHIQELTKKQFAEDYPGEEFKPYAFWGADAEDGEPHDATNAWRYDNDQSDHIGKVKTMSVIQYQYCVREKMYAVASSDGQVMEIDKKRFKKLKELFDESGMQYTEISKKLYKQCIVTKGKILKKTTLESTQFTFQAMTGYLDHSTNTRFGLVRLMRDPQMWANKWLSQIMHIVNTGAKNGLMAEKGTIPNVRKVENDYSKPGNITEVIPGALTEGRIQPKPAPQYPDGVDRLLNYAISAVQDVTGVSVELIGMADRDQPIGLEESRKKAGITMLATFFDALRRYRKNNARVVMDYVRAYLPEGTLVRIVGEQGAKYVPLIKDKMAFEYDIIVDDAPTSTNMKERVFSVLSQFLPMALQSGIPVPPDILDYAPLPETLIQKWKQLINDSQSSPEQQQMKQLQMADTQLELQKKQVEIKKGESDVMLNYAKAEQAHAIGQDESAQAMQKMGMENQMKQEQMMAQQRLKEIEFLMNYQRKQRESEMNMQHKQEMHVRNMQQPMRPTEGGAYVG